MGFAAILVFAGSALAAQAPPTRAEIEAHRVAVYSERLARFLEDFSVREPEVQQLARAELELRKVAGAGLSWTPSTEALYFAGRKLLDEEGEGGEGAQTIEMQQLAAALDLIVVPGLFAARDEGLGEALTVYVRPIGEPAPKSDYFLSLEWITPGRGQQRARREPIGPDALRGGGFEMYLRAPPSKPGAWQLFGIAAQDQAGAVAGLVPAVPVDCILDLGARVERAWEPRENEPPGRAHLRRVFELLQRFGLRTTPSLGGSRLLEAIEGWTATPPADAPVPVELMFKDSIGAEHWMWQARPAQDVRGTLLLLVPQSESTDTVFARSLGQSWIDLARENELRLCATHLPFDVRAVQPMIEREKTRAEGELIVVARGDTLARLGAALQGREQQPFDLLVLSGVIASQAPEQVFTGVERLLVVPATATERSSGDPRLTWIPGESLPLFNEPRLPELVASWLEQREASRKSPR